MKIRRAKASEAAHFSEVTLKRQLGYVIETEPPLYVSFHIQNVQEAIITPRITEHLDDLMATFRFHNGFVHTFYDAWGHLLGSFDPVELIKVHPASLKVTQWFVSQDKFKDIKTWVHTPEDVIVPVFKHEHHFVALDGHTRLKVALSKGFDTVTVYEETGNALSRAFYHEAVRRQVHSVTDCEIVDSRRYALEWDAVCDRFIATFDEKKKLRKHSLAKRQNIVAENRIQWNQVLIANLNQYLSDYAFETLGVYYPLTGEVDVRALSAHYEMFYPIIEAGRLVFAPDVGAFKRASFKTRVPDTSQRLNGPLDAVIVPGLLFDKQGVRVGYGKGYYDGYLAQSPALKIGVCFETFLQESLPKAAHDIAVDVIITENRILKIQKTHK